MITETVYEKKNGKTTVAHVIKDGKPVAVKPAAVVKEEKKSTREDKAWQNT